MYQTSYFFLDHQDLIQAFNGALKWNLVYRIGRLDTRINSVWNLLTTNSKQLVEWEENVIVSLNSNFSSGLNRLIKCGKKTLKGKVK